MNPDPVMFLKQRVAWFYDGCAADRSLRTSAAATGEKSVLPAAGFTVIDAVIIVGISLTIAIGRVFATRAAVPIDLIIIPRATALALITRFRIRFVNGMHRRPGHTRG